MSVGKGFVQYYKVLQNSTKVVTSILNRIKQVIMKTTILLLSLSAAAFSSCTTAYKSGQTPDDVYFSPVRATEEKQNNDRDNRDEVRREPARDYEISMGIRDYRWRDFNDDYNYDNSPYNYTCTKYNYGYYYNPRYYPWAIYTGKATYSKPVNSTPRMVNLNAYKGYNSNVATGKTGTNNWNSSYKYNNNNNSESRQRRIIEPSSNSSSSNNTRTYTPSSSNNSGGSSSGNSGSGSVSRPKRGG